MGSRIGKSKRKKQILQWDEGENEEENPRIPEKLSRKVYNEEWIGRLTEATKDALKIKNLIIMTADFKPKKPE